LRPTCFALEREGRIRAAQTAICGTMRNAGAVADPNLVEGSVLDDVARLGACRAFRASRNSDIAELL
jgi:hypothetical protein